ncbi:MAG: hypothetical protein JXO22_04740 [Phycisphaerae bacterium]|nr:hypothetical protein [Phycisphaerae bacterium]
MLGKRNRLVVIGIAVLALTAGCSRQRDTPAVYAPRVEVTDFAQPMEMPTNGYRLLGERATTGRFTCSIAVAKLVATGDESGDPVRLADFEPAEQGYWTEALRGLVGVRDLNYLSPVLFRGKQQPLEDLCATAGDLGAELLLAYVPGRVGPNSAELLGVIYDVANVEPIAALHAERTILNEEGVETTPDEICDEADEEDSRPYDAYYQAGREFEQSTVACLRALMQLDTPSKSTEPHRWSVPSPVGPFGPAGPRQP